MKEKLYNILDFIILIPTLVKFVITFSFLLIGCTLLSYPPIRTIIIEKRILDFVFIFVIFLGVVSGFFLNGYVRQRFLERGKLLSKLVFLTIYIAVTTLLYLDLNTELQLLTGFSNRTDLFMVGILPFFGAFISFNSYCVISILIELIRYFVSKRFKD